MKMRKTLLICLLITALSFSVLGLENTHQTKIHQGETLEIGDYEVRYTSSQGETELTFGKWTGTSFLIYEQLEGTEIYEHDGKNLELSENFTSTITRTGFDQQGRFVELNISASEDVFASGEMSTSTPENLMISQGESSEIPLTIENTGFLNQSYRLSANTSSDLSVSFSFQDFNVTEVYVPAGETSAVSAMIEVPETAELGTYTLDLVAETNETRLSESFQVEIRGAEIEKELNLDIRESFMQSAPGETVTVPLTVRSGAGGPVHRPGMGGTSLENVEFDVTVPDGWDYEMNPEGFSTVSPNEVSRSMLEVNVPENAQPGDYFVDVSASSDETSLDEPRQIRVSVAEQSNLGFVGIILMLVSLGLLVFVYRKFGRR